jgi:hypothetical protein
MDHVDAWARDGRFACVTFQPYSLSARDASDLAADAETFGLCVSVTTHSWHAPGETLMVEAWPASAD